MNNIIHIFGASGSGTSTLGRYICAQAGYTFIDTDDYFWLPTDPPFTTKRDIEERINLMRRDIDRAENAVISGSLTGWGDVFMESFTLAVRLHTDTALRISRIKAREYERFGDRILEGGDMYEANLDFVQWASEYDDGDINMRSRLCHDEWQKNLRCKVLSLSGSDTLESNWEIIKSNLL